MKSLRMNPVTLKELRQLVRTRLVTWSIVIYALLIWVITAIVVAACTDNKSPIDLLYGRGFGTNVFIGCAIPLGIIVCGLIPFLQAIRTAVEFGRDRLDMQFLTALTPMQIVRGKVVSAFLLMLVYACVTLPFMTLAYQMRGLSLDTVFITLGILLVSGLSLTVMMLLLACLDLPLALRIVLIVFLFGQMPFTGGFTAVFLADGPLSSSGDGVAFMAALASVLALQIAFGSALCAAVLSPMNTDRDRPLRRLESWTWLASAVALATISLLPSGTLGDHFKEIAVNVWSIFWMICASFDFLRAATTPTLLSRRVAATAPAGFWKRVATFPMRSGSGPGMAFALAMAAATFGVGLASCALMGIGKLDADALNGITGFAFLFCQVAGVSILAKLVVVWRGNRARHAKIAFAVVFFYFMFISNFMPAILSETSVIGSGTKNSWFGNITGSIDGDGEGWVQPIYAAVMLIVAVAFSTVYIRRAFMAYARRAEARLPAEAAK